jgi:ribose transport system substrate-binding protein
MGEAMRARRVRWTALVGVAAIAFVAATAFSQASDASRPASSKTTSAGIVAQAKADVLKYAGWPKKWKGPTKPTKPQKVKYVMLLSCSQATACARETAGSAEGAKVMGWKTQVVDGKGDPNVMSAAIRNAVVGGASGIILESTGVAPIVSALQFAKAHHVPVINNGAITAKQAGVDTSLVAGDNPDPNVQRGIVSADWMIWNSNGKAGVVIFRTTDAGLQTRDAATVARLKKCPGCTILFQDVVGFDITTTPKMTQEINSILDRFGNKVKYIRDPYSAADAFAVPALQARGRSDVQVLSDAPSQLQMQQCYQGKNIGAVYGDDLSWVGWEGVDELNRALQHPGVKPPAEHTQYVILLSPAKAYRAPGTPKSATCPKNLNFSSGNPVNFRAKFKKLWGIK